LEVADVEPERLAVVDVPRLPRQVGGYEQAAPAQLDRVDSHPGGGGIHQALGGKRRLVPAGGAVGAERSLVRRERVDRGSVSGRPRRTARCATRKSWGKKSPRTPRLPPESVDG